jgi:hypothetical protein
MSNRSRVLERAPDGAIRSASRRRSDALRPAAGTAWRLALDGRNVAALIGVRTGPQIGAAIRWLEGQVGDNLELNTSEALTALLRFAPKSAWDPTALAASSA